MTPERMHEIRDKTADHIGSAVISGAIWWDLVSPEYKMLADALSEIERLNAELTEARLSAEEAWAAHDVQETR